METMLESLRVHVAPVGFEIDRIVMPAQRYKADKVWLLVHDNASEDKAGPFLEQVQKQLAASKIRCEIKRADRLELFPTIRAVMEIIEEEQGNQVYVNVASGSKIQAIGCMMGCMMSGSPGVRPFYAEAEKYPGFRGSQLSTGVKDTKPLPAFEIKTPRPDLVRALKIIRDGGGVLTKKRLAELADEQGLIKVNSESNYSQARFASLAKNIIQPLMEQWGFIAEEKKGRTRYVRLTPEGENVVGFMG